MNDKPSEARPADVSTELAMERTELAYERNRLAGDRTLMAWMRTSLSMITFGFTIYKFFQYMRESGAVPGKWRPAGPRNLGLALIALGVALLVMAMVENILFMRRLSKAAHRKYPKSTALIAALLFSLLGLFALVSILFRTGPF